MRTAFPTEKALFDLDRKMFLPWRDLNRLAMSNLNPEATRQVDELGKTILPKQHAWRKNPADEKLLAEYKAAAQEVEQALETVRGN